MTTLIKGGWVIAFDGTQHVVLENGQVAFEGNRITYVGKNFQGETETVIDAKHCIIMPGLLSLHAHTTSSHYTRGFIEDVGSKHFYMSLLYEYISPLIEAVSLNESLISCKAAACELLKSGCTFFLEMGAPNPHAVAETAVNAGIRSCIVPGYRSARWKVSEEGRQIQYDWDRENGFRGLENNLRFIRECGKYRGMVSSILGPLQLDTCDVDLLEETVAKANEMNTKIQIHAAQSIVEFNEIMRRHGCTPIQLMERTGLLSTRTMIAHCVYITGHPHVLAPWGNDLELLSGSGASVIHCPTIFMRRGAALHSFEKYVKNGLNVALGTDTVPHDMFLEMKTAAYMCKLVESSSYVGTAKQIFESATLAGAKALGRDDLGVLKEGALADIVIVNVKDTRMSPLRDPLRNLVYHAVPSNIKTVIVDGKVVVEDGKVLTLDEEKLSAELQEAAAKIWNKFSEIDWAKRTVDEISPLHLVKQ